MRHPLHSICPYFATFPESFVTKQILAHTKRGDVVFDPFSGRGTTVFESLLNERGAAGADINLVAACIAGAKADAPTLSSVYKRLRDLETEAATFNPDLPSEPFFLACFDEAALKKILFLRAKLSWEKSRVDRFIAAVVLGSLHGESHRSPNYLSNRMPRTISTKPDYSIRWWKDKGLVAPEVDVFSVIRRMARYRLAKGIPKIRGSVVLTDSRKASAKFPELAGKVKLVVTSPPYLNTTDYAEDQWLRLWFLGGAERPQSRLNRDDRHLTINKYEDFLTAVWTGCEALFARTVIIVIRIGGASMDRAELGRILKSSLKSALPAFGLTQLGAGVTTEIVNSQIKTFRPGLTAKRFEHDFTFHLKRRTRPKR